MRIGIVGGSIAGCFAAILLRKEGYEVTVFERSKTELVGRGGGVGTTSALLKQLQEENILTKEFPCFEISKMSFIGKKQNTEPYGKLACSMPMNFHVFQWNALWKSLRNQIPHPNYRKGVKIIDAKITTDKSVELVTNKGEKETFDLVLFADGYKSLGRRILFPDQKLKYRNYILWRGLLSESKIESNELLKDAILRLSYKNEPGHNVLYFIPNQDGSTQKGERIFNWAAYIAIPPEELPQLMTNKKGKLKNGTLAPGTIRKKNVQKLKDVLTKNTPGYFADIVDKTKDSYIQVIYTMDLDAYYKNNICLIGDAGMVVQPFTGSGIFKGYHNVKDLVSCIKEQPSLEKALNQWNEKQIRDGKQILALGEQMEKAFIWEQLDFANVSEETALSWWKKAVTFPDFFTHQ